ncbi:radical SAM family heme chaperone HemW [Cutibacterium sp. V947]|uniref:radical SAM family heme chaperone HemW n=1 Tax=unclassified Cutibacterium TaxID=2649671 RepID=UPI003EE1127E
MTITPPFGHRERVCVSHYPLPETPPEPGEAPELMRLNERSSGLAAMYMHIPFCDVICNFCPFNKRITDDAKLTAYLDTLKREIDLYAATPRIQSLTFGSLAVGGGTPSALSAEQLADILRYTQGKLNFTDSAEISIEGNPSNFTEDKLLAAVEAGCNRVSFGVQSFDDGYTEMLDVPHTAADSLRAYDDARAAGLDNVGLDLIYNLPGQSLDQWLEDLDTAIKVGYDHITLFSLVIPPFTRLHSLITAEKVAMPGDHALELQMYLAATERLVSAGYEQYSVYDFCLPGKINDHAELYFHRQTEMLGVGAAAFGYLGGYMYVNQGNLTDYDASLGRGDQPVLIGSSADTYEEMCGVMAKGLRLFSVDRAYFRQRFDQDPVDVFGETIRDLVGCGLMEVSDTEICLTREGQFWGNNICREFFSPHFKEIEEIPREVLARGRLSKSGKAFVSLEKGRHV